MQKEVQKRRKILSKKLRKAVLLLRLWFIAMERSDESQEMKRVVTFRK